MLLSQAFILSRERLASASSVSALLSHNVVIWEVINFLIVSQRVSIFLQLFPLAKFNLMQQKINTIKNHYILEDQVFPLFPR